MVTAYRWIAAASVMILGFSAIRCSDDRGFRKKSYEPFDRRPQKEFGNQGRGLNDMLFGDLVEEIFGDGVSGQIMDYVYQFLNEESDAVGGAWMW